MANSVRMYVLATHESNLSFENNRMAYTSISDYRHEFAVSIASRPGLQKHFNVDFREPMDRFGIGGGCRSPDHVSLYAGEIESEWHRSWTEWHRMRKVGEGDKSEVFALQDGRILKLFFTHYADLAPEEAAVSEMLARAGVQAPRVDETVEVDGRPGIVFANLREGQTLSSAVRSRPWQILVAARELADMHASVHDSSSCELPSQRRRLEDEIRSAECISDQARSTALHVLAELPDGETVCHNDIHMLNVIVHPAESMIIDWVLATRGNPLADIAGAVLQLRFGEQPRGLIARLALELGRSLFWRWYLRRYLELHPGRREELLRWELPVAAALAGRREGRMRQQLLKCIDSRLGIERCRPAGVQT